MRIKAISETETYIYETEDKSSFTIGRSSEADFTIRVNELSKVHCKIYLEDNQIFIEDMNSKNGVRVDGEKIPAEEKIEIFPDSSVLITSDLQLNLFGNETQTALKVEAVVRAKPLVRTSALKRKYKS
ncbi:MAG: FHA domain-containing protein [Candidatus Caldatribacteriota bacterium]